MDLSEREEASLLNAIVDSHPHKALLDNLPVKFYVIRKGWGNWKRRFANEPKEESA